MLYDIPLGQEVAVISEGEIDWYVIDGIHRYWGTPTGAWCVYSSSGPFYGLDGSVVSGVEIADAHYTKPLAIQTCYCEDGKSGLYLLTGEEKIPKEAKRAPARPFPLPGKNWIYGRPRPM